MHTSSIDRVGAHPADQFLQAGLSVVPCADNSLLSRTDTRGEYEALLRGGVLSATQLAAIARDAHSAAFVKH